MRDLLTGVVDTSWQSSRPSHEMPREYRMRCGMRSTIRLLQDAMECRCSVSTPVASECQFDFTDVEAVWPHPHAHRLAAPHDGQSQYLSIAFT